MEFSYTVYGSKRGLIIKVVVLNEYPVCTIIS